VRARREQVALRLSAAIVFEIAALIQSLREARKGDPLIYGDGSLEKDGQGLLLSRMKHLSTLLDQYGLAQAESRLLADLTARFQEHYGDTPKVGLRENDRRELQIVAEQIEAPLRKRFLGADFVDEAPPEGSLDYHELLYRGVKHFFGEETGELPLVAWHDLEETINCLCFGAPTAGVVIGIRAVEEMLRDLHSSIIGEAHNKNWGQVLRSIREGLEERQMQPAKLLSLLDYLNEMRNESAYSDKVYTLEQAERVFTQSIIAVQEIKKLKSEIAAGPEPPEDEEEPEAEP